MQRFIPAEIFLKKTGMKKCDCLNKTNLFISDFPLCPTGGQAIKFFKKLTSKLLVNTPLLDGLRIVEGISLHVHSKS